MSDKRNLVLVLIGLFLLASIGTSFMLPHLFVSGADGTTLFGADLLNLFIFHNCTAADDNYYLATWEMCGEPFQRNMVYPPILYRSFFWLSFLSFSVALAVWTLVIIFSFLLAGFILSMAMQKESLSVRPLYFWVAWLLLGMQVPLLFAIERGNNDIYVLLLFSSGLYLAQKDNWMGVGALLALVTAYKLYPVFLVMNVVLVAFKVRKAKPLLLSLATSGLVLFVLFFGEHLYYLQKVLPFWAAKKSGEAWAFDHVILNMNKVLPTLGTECASFYWQPVLA